jgi:hypothetical protein
MSPLLTHKYKLAIEVLQAQGLLPSALALLADKGSAAVYSELAKRGLVWSPDLHRWRKTKKPRKIRTAIVHTGYLDHTEVRLIVRSNEYNQAIEEFEGLMRMTGYEVHRVTVHTSRNPGELLVYCVLHKNGHDNG